jgi:serine/threonine-protein kinase
MSETAPSTESSLTPGRVIGARFAVERVHGTDPFGTLVAARDQKTKKAVLLRILTPGLFATPQAAEILRNEVRVATTTTHKHLGSVFGTGADGGSRFVASEWLSGTRLSDLVSEKRAAGDPIPLREACAMVAQICDAIQPLHVRHSAHGAVRPAIVMVTDHGVKLDEVGIARAVVRTAGAAALGEATLPYVAPELRSGPGEPTVAADVFGLGSILYGVLCLRAPDEHFVAPSVAHPEGTPALDAILLRCLAPDPTQRYASAHDLRAALGPFVNASSEQSLDVDVDVDIPLSVAPAAPEGPPLPRVQIPKAPPTPRIDLGTAPAVGQRISLHEDFRPSAISLVPDGGPAPTPSAQVDLGSLLKKITENDAPRWMAQKDGLDHGPFSGRELVELIAKGEVLGDHGLLNMDTGERKKVSEWPDFIEFVEQHRLKRAIEAETHAIAHSEKVEKRGNVAKFLFAGAAIAAILLVLGVFLYTRGAEQDQAIANSDLADLYARGEVQIEGAAGILPDPPRGSGRRGSGGHRSGGGGGGGRSYEDAMNEAMDIGDATRSGGEGRLSPAQVAGVMNGQINSMFGCVSSELRGGRSLGRVRIDMAIAGSGQVIGSSVRAGSPEFQRCIQGRVGSIRFPSFGAPRMGASYSFDASQ